MSEEEQGDGIGLIKKRIKKFKLFDIIHKFLKFNLRIWTLWIWF